jgi:hypothetical protein
MMTSTRAKPIRRIQAPVHARAVEGSRDVPHDPAGLGATLREVAARAHRAVRAIDGASKAGAAPEQAAESLRELADLHPRIVQLQRRVDASSQEGLSLYLSALRREVEGRLC